MLNYQQPDASGHFGDACENDFFEMGGELETGAQGLGARLITPCVEFFLHQRFELGEVFPAIAFGGALEEF